MHLKDLRNFYRACFVSNETFGGVLRHTDGELYVSINILQLFSKHKNVYAMYMVTLNEYRKAIGSRADGLSDAELQKRLDYAERFADAFYEYWHKRKDYNFCRLTGKCLLDMATDSERYEREMAAGRPIKQKVLTQSDGWVTIQYEITLDEDLVRGVREIWKMKKQNHLV